MVGLFLLFTLNQKCPRTHVYLHTHTHIATKLHTEPTRTERNAHIYMYELDPEFKT